MFTEETELTVRDEKKGILVLLSGSVSNYLNETRGKPKTKSLYTVKRLNERHYCILIYPIKHLLGTTEI